MWLNTLSSRSVSLHLHLQGVVLIIFISTVFTQTLFDTNHFLQKHAETSFCINQFLHKPKTFFTQTRFYAHHLYTNLHLHKPARTQTCFYQNLVWPEPPFAPVNFYSDHFLHQPALLFLCPDQAQPRKALWPAECRRLLNMVFKK